MNITGRRGGGNRGNNITVEKETSYNLPIPTRWDIFTSRTISGGRKSVESLPPSLINICTSLEKPDSVANFRVRFRYKLPLLVPNVVRLKTEFIPPLFRVVFLFFDSLTFAPPRFIRKYDLEPLCFAGAKILRVTRFSISG